MADKRITDLTTALELTNTDFMAVDNTEDGTRKFRVGDLIDNVEQYVDDAVDAEASVRESADTALGGRIDNEITARQQADTALGGRIDDEATTRANADTALGTRITNLKLADLGDDSTHRTVTDTEKSTWSGKQDALTFDDVPTEDSDNPVKSGGVYDAIASEASTRQTNIDNLSNETIHIDSDGKFFVYTETE